jgi:putative endonuclease
MTELLGFHILNTLSGRHHMRSNAYYVYIMASRSGAMYVGVTNNLERRVFQHKHGTGSEFTAKYLMTKLVYWEDANDIRAAIMREKQIKGWRRAKKIELIEAINPRWLDLAADWFNDSGKPLAADHTLST